MTDTPHTKPYKEHLRERLTTTEDIVGYLSACYGEGPDVFRLAVKDVLEFARTPSTPAVDSQPVPAGEQEDSVSLYCPDCKSQFRGTAGNVGFTHSCDNQRGSSSRPASIIERAEVQHAADCSIYMPMDRTCDCGAIRTPSVSECLMADCRNPQEHFCFQHCEEVYGTKSVDDERLSLLAARPDVQPDDARVERLQAQLNGVMNCLAISQQEVERLRARPDVWEQAIATRRSIIADSELTDIEEEFARWQRRSSGEEGKAEYCASFLSGYIPVLLKALRTIEAARDAQEGKEL